MHELSIAMSIVDAASEEARRLGATAVDAVYVRVGDLSGVVSDALRFSYELAAADTILASSNLVIEPIAVTVHCPTCDEERPVRSTQTLSCRVCGSPSAEIVKGRELLLTALEIRS